MTRKQCFDPVVNDQVRILILGSLPSDISLAQNEYYAHRQNHFWMLMSEVVGVHLPSLAYPARLQSLLENGIGLWDVVAEATRDGSLDSNIRAQANNDLVGLVSNLSNLNTIAFNGGTAAKLGLKALQSYANRYRIVKLPSSSPAYTLPYDEKMIVWRTLADDRKPSLL